MPIMEVGEVVEDVNEIVFAFTPPLPPALVLVPSNPITVGAAQLMVILLLLTFAPAEYPQAIPFVVPVFVPVILMVLLLIFFEAVELGPPNWLIAVTVPLVAKFENVIVLSDTVSATLEGLVVCAVKNTFPVVATLLMFAMLLLILYNAVTVASQLTPVNVPDKRIADPVVLNVFPTTLAVA